MSAKLSVLSQFRREHGENLLEAMTFFLFFNSSDLALLESKYLTLTA